MSAPDFSASVRRLFGDDGSHPPFSADDRSCAPSPVVGGLPVRPQPPAEASRDGEVGGRSRDLAVLSPRGAAGRVVAPRPPVPRSLRKRWSFLAALARITGGVR